MACVSKNNTGCLDRLGCPDRCPDFVIRQYDTKPDFRFDVEDSDGPIDLTDLVCEASMWSKGKLKKALAAVDTQFALADNVGFEQAQVGDVVVMSRARAPEQMLVTGFDETNRLVRVQRGYNGSLVSPYPKGAGLRFFRVLNAVAGTELTKEDIPQVDGTTKKDILTRSALIYEWQSADTSLAGCYWFEFKLLKMMDSGLLLGSVSNSTPVSFVSYTPIQVGLGSGDGVQWVRRYPTSGEGFLVRIGECPTAENVAS